MIHCAKCGVVPVPEERSAGAAAGRRSTSPSSGNPLDRRPGVEEHHLSRPAAARRCATPTRWIPSRIRPGISPASPIRMRETPVNKDGGGLLAAGGSVYRRHRACDPASALCALLHPRHEQAGPGLGGRTFRRPVHPGHGLPRDLQGRGRQLGLARRSGKARRQGLSARAPARRSTIGAVRENVQVQKECDRAGSASSPITAPTPSAGSCCRTRRPNATSNGPMPAPKAAGVLSSASGAWPAKPKVCPRPAPPPRRRRSLQDLAPGHAQGHRGGDRTSGGSALQQRRGAALHAGQCHRAMRRQGRCRRRGARRWKPWCCCPRR